MSSSFIETSSFYLPSIIRSFILISEYRCKQNVVDEKIINFYHMSENFLESFTRKQYLQRFFAKYLRNFQ